MHLKPCCCAMPVILLKLYQNVREPWNGTVTKDVSKECYLGPWVSWHPHCARILRISREGGPQHRGLAVQQRDSIFACGAGVLRQRPADAFGYRASERFHSLSIKVFEVARSMDDVVGGSAADASA